MNASDLNRNSARDDEREDETAGNQQVKKHKKGESSLFMTEPTCDPTL